MLPAWRDTAVADLLAYQNWGAPFATYERAPLLAGLCMDHRQTLRVPERFAFVLRAAGARLPRAEFQVSFAIGVGGVTAIALIGHTQCGMTGLAERRAEFIAGLVARAGWSADAAAAQFDADAPSAAIDDAARFVCDEARRLAALYPQVPVAPLLYDVDTHQIDQLADP